MRHQKFILLIMIPAIALAGAACRTTAVTGPLASYMQVKKSLIKTLEEKSGVSGDYRVMAIPPLIQPYEPGVPLSKGSFEPLTNSCKVPNLVQVPITGVPGLTSKNTFSLSFGLPYIVHEAIKEIADINASVSRNHETNLSYSDLWGFNPPRDELEEACRNIKCLDAIIGRDILMIRGQIWGKEIISSEASLQAGFTATAIKEDAIEVKYDSSGNYEIMDKKARPIFWYVSEWRVEIPGLVPDASRAERFSRIEDFLRTETKASLEVKEKAPSSETLKQLQEKLERQ